MLSVFRSGLLWLAGRHCFSRAKTLGYDLQVLVPLCSLADLPPLHHSINELSWPTKTCIASRASLSRQLSINLFRLLVFSTMPCNAHAPDIRVVTRACSLIHVQQQHVMSLQPPSTVGNPSGGVEGFGQPPITIIEILILLDDRPARMT